MFLFNVNYLLPPPEREPLELLPPERLPDEELPDERELLLLLEEDLTEDERVGVVVLLYVLVGVFVLVGLTFVLVGDVVFDLL